MVAGFKNVTEHVGISPVVLVAGQDVDNDAIAVADGSLHAADVSIKRAA